MKFKVGEKIRVYQGRDRYTGYVSVILLDDSIKIEELDTIFNPKQCRKLKPKRKAREFWIIQGSTISSASFTNSVVMPFKPENPEQYIHVREVIGKGDGK